MNLSKNFYQAAKWPFIIMVLLLVVPLVGMQFSNEVAWNTGDFIVMGFLLFGIGFIYQWATIQLSYLTYRAAVALALVSGFTLTWANLAVGIIGSENNPQNLMYLGVVFVLVVGTLWARFRPQQMAIVLFTTASAQVLTIVIALMSGMQYYSGSSVYEIIAVNGLFVILFSISGGLFWIASKNPVALK